MEYVLRLLDAKIAIDQEMISKLISEIEEEGIEIDSEKFLKLQYHSGGHLDAKSEAALGLSAATIEIKAYDLYSQTIS